MHQGCAADRTGDGVPRAGGLRFFASTAAPLLAPVRIRATMEPDNKELPMVASAFAAPEPLTADPWPSLPLDEWQDTCATLHLWTQVIGKIRLAQTPWLNHSWH